VSIRFVEPKDLRSLEALETNALLARLNALRFLEESAALSDWSDEELAPYADLIVFKNTDEWRVAYAEVKSVLATREHVPRGSKQRRQQAAHMKKHR